jgi:hypothetical protein
MTPSPNQIGSEKRNQKPWQLKATKATTHLSLFVASTPDISSALAAFRHLNLSPFVALCRYRGVISSHFNFHLLSSAVFHYRAILSGDD